MVRHGFQQAQGQAQEAAVLYQRALLTREHALGPDHPIAIDIRERLHEVLVALGKTQEAAHKQEGMAPEKNGLSEA